MGGVTSDTKALDKGRRSAYDPYISYYASGRAGVLGEKVRDKRLPKKEFVIGLEKDGKAMAYPYRLLNEVPVVNDVFHDVPIVVALDPDSRTGVVFQRNVEGQILTFDVAEDQGEWSLVMVDQETGSKWMAVSGEAVEGPLDGAKLKRFRFHLTFWFAWKDYYPYTEVYVRR